MLRNLLKSSESEVDEYYYGLFRLQFGSFWNSLESNGSTSAFRAHNVIDLFGNRHEGPVGADSGWFSYHDLYASTDLGLPDHLSNIPQNNQIDFLCGVFYILLIDQVMYTHFQSEYAKFRAMTLYPKMDNTHSQYGNAAAGSASPFSVFDSRVLKYRKLNDEVLAERFDKWIPFMIGDLRLFFWTNADAMPSWPEVREAMMSDSDCHFRLPFGIPFLHHLRDDLRRD